MNLGAILKMLGIKVPPEVVGQIEAILPKLPAIIQQSIATINGALRTYDERLTNIEQTQLRILEELQNVNSSERPAGIGATQRAFESGNGTD
jgi:hypothetical protein